MTTTRERRDMCPGACRPWPAEDGLLVRLRLIGGHVSAGQLAAVSAVAGEYGDGVVHVTTRANLQLRALPGDGTGALRPDVHDALGATGLLPSPTRELMRNVMVSSQTGIAGGLLDLRPVAAELDRLIRTLPGLDDLPGRFLFVLDDGRGDLLDRRCDLGLVAVSATEAQLRVGDAYAEVVPMEAAAARLGELAVAFAEARGTGETAPWHVRELPHPLVEATPADPRIPAPTAALPFGVVPGGTHRPVPDSGLTPADVRELCALGDDLIVTPWRGVFIPEGNLG